MRYDHFSMLPERAFQKRAFGGMTLEGGGGSSGGSSGPSTTNVTNTNIPEYARPYVENMLGATQQQLFNISDNGQITGIKPYQPYSQDPTAYVAGFSPLQQQAFYGAANLAVPQEYQAAGLMTGAAGAGSMGLGTQAAGAGQQYAQMATSPGYVGAYMSPYVQQALQPQLAEMQRQSDITQQALRGQATAAGAFGGNRQALQSVEQERNKQALMGQAIGQGYQSAYDKALQSMQYGAGLGLQGLQAGIQGYGQGINAANQLANIGGQGLQAQQSILNAQQQAGAMQQAQQQNIINQAIQNYATAQQYPQQQLAFMNAMLRGLPLQTATTQTYQAPPSPYSQLAGLGTTAYSMGKLSGAFKEGGKVQKYASGGITDINRKVLLDPEKYSAQTLQRSMADGIVNPLVGQLAMQENADYAQRVQNAQAGIDQANINPEMFAAAGGGIVAFADGDLVNDIVEKETREIEQQQRSDYSPEAKQAMAAQAAQNKQRQQDYFKREQRGMLQQGREAAGLASPQTTKALTAPAGIAAYPDEAKRGTAKGIVEGGPKAPGKSAQEWGIGLPQMLAAAPTETQTAPTARTAATAAETKPTTSGIDEYEELRKRFGIKDPKEALSADREEIAAMKEKVTKDREEAKYMAMLQAGLGMMGGKSQYALQNIGEGAQKGVESYSKSMQDIKADEKEYAKINRELNKAEDALRRGDLEKYLDHKDKARQLDIQAAGVKAQQIAANKSPAEIQLIERYAAEKRIPFSQALKEIATLKAEPKSRDAAFKEWSENTMLQNKYPKFEDYYSAAAGTNKYQGFSAKPLGQ